MWIWKIFIVCTTVLSSFSTPFIPWSSIGPPDFLAGFLILMCLKKDLLSGFLPLGSFSSKSFLAFPTTCNLLQIIFFPIFLICTKFVWILLFFLKMPFNNIKKLHHICLFKTKGVLTGGMSLVHVLCNLCAACKHLVLFYKQSDLFFR